MVTNDLSPFLHPIFKRAQQHQSLPYPTRWSLRTVERWIDAGLNIGNGMNDGFLGES